jgi:hypothetical protein
MISDQVLVLQFLCSSSSSLANVFHFRFFLGGVSKQASDVYLALDLLLNSLRCSSWSLEFVIIILGQVWLKKKKFTWKRMGVLGLFWSTLNELLTSWWIAKYVGQVWLKKKKLHEEWG